jgi:hypothetical protein
MIGCYALSNTLKFSTGNQLPAFLSVPIVKLQCPIRIAHEQPKHKDHRQRHATWLALDGTSMIDVMGNVVPMYDRVTLLLNRVQAKYNNDRNSTEIHHQLGTMISETINNTASQAVASTTKAVKKQYASKDPVRVAVTPAAHSSSSKSDPSETGHIAPTDIGSVPSSSPDCPSDSSSRPWVHGNCILNMPICQLQR